MINFVERSVFEGESDRRPRSAGGYAQGGDTYKPALDGLGLKYYLSIMDNQFDLLTNAFDDAVGYFSLGNNFFFKFLVVIS